MPIIECKNMERLHSEDILLEDAGPLIKAGQKVGKKVGELTKHKAGVYKVISLSKEEKDRLVIDNTIEEQIAAFIKKRTSARLYVLKERLKEIILELHSPFNENLPLFNIPGKKGHLQLDGMLENELDSLYRLQVSAGSNRIINKYKLKFAIEVLKEIYEIIDHFKPRELGEREAKGLMPRVNLFSIRLNSKYDGGRFSMLGNSTIHQAVDTAILFLYTMTNINKQRILQGAPLSEDRFDPDKHTDSKTKYQYRKGLIVDAAVGIMLHNIGFSHSSIHEIVSAKSVVTEWGNDSKEKIRKIQRNINVSKHILDAIEISSISKMMVSLQRDYPDGTGFPYLNSNKFKHEFLRIFQIIDCYDQMTNPFCGPTVYCRQDVINHIEKLSGEYVHNSHKFEACSRFDIEMLNEFKNILAMYELGEKIYLYDKTSRSQHLFVGKIHSYLDSDIPLISILKDEKKNKEYTDGQVLFYIPRGEAYFKINGKLSRKQFPWISNLVIVDKSVDPGNINEYEDLLYGKARVIAKHYR